ncbi:short-chain dehydrogenase of unknown substrate specificity [Hoeflea sp. IMCC20628]|uniref:SDR family NAD(P)-dependent oxidoreductase n=1 Tax=Hoeflea sp. IMCC20628 TaxID=1620421 RepID=UPI00063ADDBF|nr:SDR family NAD(P)-dependent oxidoreductase [Hoeflea sp. IMCC20628]AKI02837.1 short-chain dehydrogenase of unknown substrate specificity [Hoeflea sp. IMCC20628]
MSQPKGLIVITGASRGIGLALVYCYLKAGFPVLAIARNAASMRPHKNLTALDADLTDQTAIARIADLVEMTALPIAVLINNAGIQNAIDFTDPDIGGETSARKMRDEIALNLTAPILLIQSLLPLMLRPGGTIINVTSLVSRQPKPSAPVYSATKAGLASFTQSLRVQLLSEGIHLVEAVPPLVDTEMTAGRGSGKMSPQAIAHAIFESVRHRKRLVAPGLSRRVLILNRLLPELVRRILARS